MSKSTFGQALQALNLIHAKDLSSERLTALYNSGLLSDLLDADPAKINREAFRASLLGGTTARSAATKRKFLASTALAATPGTEPFCLTVEYSSLETMIASGQYDWRNSEITPARFPVTGTDKVALEARYFHFNHAISSEKAAEEMEAAGWEPARIEHLLALGTTHPEEQRKHPIVALGSVAEVGGDRRVPVLDGDGAERYLFLSGWDGDWDPPYRFLAVRKLSVA